MLHNERGKVRNIIHGTHSWPAWPRRCLLQALGCMHPARRDVPPCFMQLRNAWRTAWSQALAQDRCHIMLTAGCNITSYLLLPPAGASHRL